MKKYTIYTKEIVMGKTQVMARNKDEAYDLIQEDIEHDLFRPDLSVPVKANIRDVVEEA